MQPIVNVDPRIYGGEAPSTTEVPTIDPQAGVSGGAAIQQPYEAPARVSQDLIGAGSSAVAEGQAAIAAANRVKATGEEAAIAAVKSWSTTRLFQWYNMPHFAVDPTFDPKPYINMAPLALTVEEHKFLAQARSEDEYSFGDVPRVVDILKEKAGNPEDAAYRIVPGANHGFTGKEEDLATLCSDWIVSQEKGV